MAAVPTDLMLNASVVQSPQSPQSRRWLIVVLVAIVVGVACWVGGLFEGSFFTRLVHQATTKPTAAAEHPVALSAVIPPQPIGNDSSISPVPLPLILTGTMPGRNAREGHAFIGINQDSPQTYVAGAILANNARLAEIYTDHVVLERDGKRVDLYLLGSSNHSDAAQLNGLLTVGGTPPPPPAKVTSHELLTDYLRPSPVYEGARLKGYQVYPGQHSGVFYQMALQAGDVITALNGVPLNEPTSAIEQLKQLSEGYAVTATVERKDKTETLSLDGGLILADQERLRNPPPNPIMNMPPM